MYSRIHTFNSPLVCLEHRESHIVRVPGREISTPEGGPSRIEGVDPYLHDRPSQVYAMGYLQVVTFISAGIAKAAKRLHQFLALCKS